MTPELIQTVAVILGPAGACWAVLNGTRARVKETNEAVKEMSKILTDHGERLVRIETKMEAPK